jgi:4-amino-4-deoxy-L-arabinose transferase-like glycosyltransferase
MTQLTGTQLVILLVIWTGAAMAVFRHAERRHDRHATAWGVGTFLALGVAVPLYLLHVARERRRASRPPSTGDGESRETPLE